MPIAAKYPIDKIIEVCKIYTEITKRRITFEYALIAGLNDSKEDAIELAKRVRGMICHVNLIPVNTVEGSGFVKSSKKNAEAFMDTLLCCGIQTTIRRELGTDINAACGQLRRSILVEE
jgi:23S rRNA (adenine2503-C2)-methyltransferase